MLPRLLILPIVLATTPAAAVVVISAPGAPDPGIAKGETLVVDFDAANAKGIVETSWGTEVRTGRGSIGGVRAAPAGDETAYRAIGWGSGTTFDFSQWTGNRPLASLSFYWGSIDRYNYVDLFDSHDRRVATIGGSDLPIPDGSWTSADANRRLYMAFKPKEDIRKVTFRSDGAAFEFDSLGAAGAVPEPATWVTLIAGFGLVGLAIRRRRDRSVAA